MTSKAVVKFSVENLGVTLAVVHETAVGNTALLWEQPAVTTLDPGSEAPDGTWLRLAEDDARAIYEALADYFGHSGNDVRALRRDYDSERGRVDRLIGAVIGERR